MIKRLLLLVLLTISCHHFGQSQNDFFAQHPISITIFSHSIGVPFKDYVKKPLNLGVSIGTELQWRGNDNNTTSQGFQLGWYHHKNLGSGLFLKTDLTQRFYASNGVWGEISVSGGYFHTFNISDVYQLNTEGIYEKVRDKGTPAFLVGGGIGAGYLTQNRINPFIKYEALLEMPYTKFVPMMPHLLFGVGSWTTFE